MEQVPDDEDEYVEDSFRGGERRPTFCKTRREGEHLKNDLLGKLDYMVELVAFIEERSPKVLEEYRNEA